MRVFLGFLVLLAGCAPTEQITLPKGDFEVTTHSRLFGLEATKAHNEQAASRTCPEGYIVLNEKVGQDAEGNYRRWEFGCLSR